MSVGEEGSVRKRQKSRQSLGGRWRISEPLRKPRPGGRGPRSSTSPAHTSHDLGSFFLGWCHLKPDLNLIYKMYLAYTVPARKHSFHFVFELSRTLTVFFFFPGLSWFDKPGILIQSFDQRESVSTFQSSCPQSYDQSTLKPASNLYAFKIMFSLGPYGKSYVCIWEYSVFCLCLRYFKCSLQTHVWENKQYWCHLWQATYSHIKSIF